MKCPECEKFLTHLDCEDQYFYLCFECGYTESADRKSQINEAHIDPKNMNSKYTDQN